MDDYSKKVEAGGGKILMPKMPLPGFGYIALCLDSEGNNFAIMQDDPSAT